MCRRNRTAAAVAAALLALAGVAGGTQLTPIQIDFEIAEPDYRDEYTASQRADLRRDGATLFARLLAQEVGFLAFSPAVEAAAVAAVSSPATESEALDCPDSAADYRLCIRLDGLERGSQGVSQEVGLHFQLVGPEVQEEARGYWRFRSSGEFLQPIPEPRDLLAEMELKLEDADYPGLVREVLSQVKIGESCLVRKEMPSGWILPFTREDLCMDRDTKLSIEHEVLVAMITQKLSFEAEASGELTAPGSPEDGRVFCPADGLDPERLAKLHSAPAEAVGKTAIFVVDYQRLDIECSRQPESPVVVDFEERVP